MGKYIETDSNKNKAEWIRNNLDGNIIGSNPPTTIPIGFVLVCVVDNGPFEAAAIAYNERKIAEFSMETDFRAKTWLLIPKTRAIEACPSVEGYLS